MAAFIITRIQTGDYDRWRPMFDQDKPRAREDAVVQRVLRSVDDPNEVFIYLEFETLEDPGRPGRMKDEWTNEDGDHPSIAGYRRLGELAFHPFWSS